jgi:alpha-galactosidase
MSLKIAMIGAGSIGFTRRLIADILTVPELGSTHFSLMDINEHNLSMVHQLVERDIRANGLPATVTATTDRREALLNADYIICTIRQGGLDAFATDIDIPLKYGIDQCVGDTLSAGGIMYGQRGIPAILDICRDIRDVAKPNALLLNYSNPMCMLTWAAIKYGGVRTVGLCHGVQGAQHQIAKCVEFWAKSHHILDEDETVSRKDIDFVFSGINHQTWCIKATWQGVDLIPIMPELFDGHPEYPKTEKVRIDVLKRFGYYSTESNGHLSEYLPWYRKRPSEIMDWIDLSSWINGETGGYLRVCTEGRTWFETDFPNWMQEEPKKFRPESRSDEHGSYIIEALETGRIYRGHFNVPNDGYISNLPDGCIVEVPGYVDRNGINVPVVGPLPLACAATCAASVRVQEMAVEAAINADVTLLKQAMLHDPLVGAICNPEEVWQLTDEMLCAQAEWLPQYVASGAIDDAARRLETAERLGMRVKTDATYQGAARIAIKSVDALQADAAAARENAQAADKGKQTHNA